MIFSFYIQGIPYQFEGLSVEDITWVRSRFVPGGAFESLLESASNLSPDSQDHFVNRREFEFLKSEILRRTIASKHLEKVAKRSLEQIPFHQVSVVGNRVPITVQIRPKPLKLDKQAEQEIDSDAAPLEILFRPTETFLQPNPMDGLEIEFTIKSPTGRIIPGGNAVTDHNGWATTYFIPQERGNYSVHYKIKNDMRDCSLKSGCLTVIKSDQPVLALDWDSLRKHYAPPNLIALFNKLKKHYQLIALSNHPDASYAFYEQYHLKNLPILYNDYRYSPLNPAGLGFDENQLEKIKHLKFVNGVPIVGVLSRTIERTQGYEQSRILPITLEINLADSLKQIAVLHLQMRAYFENYQANKTNPDFTMEGITGSPVVEGNSIQWFLNNEKAARRYLELKRSR